MTQFNSKYDTNKVDTTDNALNPANRLIPNVDNNLQAMYTSLVGNSVNTASDTNTSTNSLYGATDGQFNVEKAGTYNGGSQSDKLGYSGLKIGSGSDLPESVSKKIFSSEREGSGNSIYKGLLYKYGTKKSLINTIKEMTSKSQIISLMKDIRDIIPTFDMDGIYNAQTLAQTQEVVIGPDGDGGIMATIPNEAFQRFTGNITEKPFYDNPSASTTKYAAYAEQVNYLDLRYINGDKDNEEIKTLDQLKTNLGDTLFYNLLMSAVFDDSTQSIVINEIASNNKFTIYDINAKTALGSKWVEN